MPLTTNDIYLWRRKSIYKNPWDRQHLNVDFLKFEQKRINNTKDWYNKFQKASLGDTLEDVDYFVVPISLDSYRKAEIFSRNYNYVGVSALKNSLQMGLILVFPEGTKLPKEYSLIKIYSPIKEVISNKDNTGLYIIYAEKFERLDPSTLYVDVPSENKSVHKFFLENFHEDDVARTFQPVISSSPYQVENKGGISLSTFSSESHFSREFFTTLKLMQPLEYSDISNYFPKRLKLGFKHEFDNGLSFQVAEKQEKGILSKNHFSAFSSYNYDSLKSELVKREVFRGEYSIASSIQPKGDSSSDLLKDFTSKFVNTEITRPFNAENLYHSDIDLKKVRHNINEDIQLQIAKQRTSEPSIEVSHEELNRLRKDISQQWKVVADELKLELNNHRINTLYPKKTLSNVMRIAQSIARDSNLNSVDSSTINKSFKMFVDNSDSLVNNSDILKHVKIDIPKQRENEKIDAIRAELDLDCLTLNQLYESLKELYLFKDIHDLQYYVDELLKAGYIFEPTQGKYKAI